MGKRVTKKQHLLKTTTVTVFLIAAFGLCISISHQSPTKNMLIKNRNNKNLSYGYAVGYTLPLMSVKQRQAELAAIKSQGFDEIRYNIDWSAVQPKDSKTYQWKLTDSIVKDVNDSGLKSVITLDRTPPWARAADCQTSIFCPPVKPIDFATFSTAAVQRYQKYNVLAWEIWNEPNIKNFWKPYPDPNHYQALMTAAYTAIKIKVPSATVVVAGLAGNAIDGEKSFIDPRTFLQQLYTAGLKNHFDGIAYHPYTNLGLPLTPDPHNGWLKMNVTQPSIRSIMTANNDTSKGLWITEFGIPTGGTSTEITDLTSKVQPEKPDHVSLAVQSQIARAALADAKSYPWVKDFDWYNYKDTSTSAADAENFYGLFDKNNKSKPAFDAFKQVLR
jgi:hypothetical protein